MQNRIPIQMAGYPPELTGPMREELTALGVQSLETPDAVDEVLGKSDETTLVVVNSVCGCAAGQARPGVALAIQHEIKPDNVVTVFAGVDCEATARAREYFKGYQPSSPQIALMKDGEVAFMLERYHVENNTADVLADVLKKAFETYCKPAEAAE